MKAPRGSLCLLTLALALPLACCGRDVAEAIQDNSQELSGLRRAIQEFGEQRAFEAPARPQLDEALAPLRDVLTQLGEAQRELAEKQRSLTQEMRRWTMLIVQQQGSKPSADATQLAARLEQLEQSLQQQDARHREVETLLQGALDHTADRLQDFLERLEASKRAPRRDAPANDGGQSDVPGGGGEGDRGAEATRSGDEQRGAAGGEREGGGDDERQQAGSWWWWCLIGLTLVGGAWLLVIGRRHRPVAIAPRTRASPDADPPDPDLQAGAEALAIDGARDDWLRTASLPDPPPHEQPPQEQRATAASADAAPVQAPADEPEVEELWAAAALLGEAIGKLKQNGVDPADALRELPDAHDGVDLHDLFVVGEPEVEAPRGPEAAAEPRDAPPPRPQRAPARGATSPKSAVERAPTPIQCWLPARDAAEAAALVRHLLGSDPRVLVVPAPEVQPAGGELHVSFSVLPGLPAGERSLIEQRLRDGVV